MDKKVRTTAPRAGYKFEEFARAVSLSRAYLYGLPPELRPRSVKFGSRRVIIEKPEDYLARIAALQPTGRAA